MAKKTILAIFVSVIFTVGLVFFLYPKECERGGVPAGKMHIAVKSCDCLGFKLRKEVVREMLGLKPALVYDGYYCFGIITADTEEGGGNRLTK